MIKTIKVYDEDVANRIQLEKERAEKSQPRLPEIVVPRKIKLID